METLTLSEIQASYERFENHKGIQAINKAIDKVISSGKIKRELNDGTIASRWVNSLFQAQYFELVEMRNKIIEKEFPELISLLKKF